jgi:GT2 family glycosyltransferase
MQVQSGFRTEQDAYKALASTVHSRMSLKPRISIVILNWNGWADTIQCLKSLWSIEYDNYFIVIVDNASTDDSVPKIREYIERELRHFEIMEISEDEIMSSNGEDNMHPQLFRDNIIILIRNTTNHGFAEGNNVGIKFAIKAQDPKHVLLLNNDTTVDKLFLEELSEAIEENEMIGSVQALLLRPGGKLIDSLGQEILWTTVRDIGFGSKYVCNSSEGIVEIFGSCAAAALYRASALKEVGLFDESFFIMGEDVELSWRLRLKGYSSYLVPSSIVYHHRGISGGRRTDSVLMGKYFGNRNWLLLVLRYYPLSVMRKAPRRLLSVFIRCISSGAALGRVHEAGQLFIKSLMMRRTIARNPTLVKVQSRWIKEQNIPG